MPRSREASPKSRYRNDAHDFGNMEAQVPLDAGLKGDRTRGTAHARPVESDLNLTGSGHCHQFDIPAILLDSRSDQVQDRSNPLPKLGGGISHGY
jgi:hypothetical protein